MNNDTRSSKKAAYDKQALIKMTSKLKNTLDELAAGDGVTVSEWIREAIYQRIEWELEVPWPRS